MNEVGHIFTSPPSSSSPFKMSLDILVNPRARAGQVTLVRRHASIVMDSVAQRECVRGVGVGGKGIRDTLKCDTYLHMRETSNQPRQSESPVARVFYWPVLRD